MITHEISIDYQNVNPHRKILNVKQYDYMSRQVNISLFDGGAEYVIPQDITEIRLAYKKRDGTGGVYSRIGTEPAYTISENRKKVAVILHPQTMTCAGIVECELQIIGADTRLCTFRWQLDVEMAADEGASPSEDYYNVLGIGGLPLSSTIDDADIVPYYDVSAGKNKGIAASALKGGSLPTTTVVNAQSTDQQIPTAKAVYTAIQSQLGEIDDLVGSGVIT